MNMIKRLWKEDEGATMVEYGILVALVSVVAIVAIGVVGGYVLGAFEDVGTKMGEAGITDGSAS